MQGQTKLLLDKIEVDYIRSQIDTGDNIRIKSALQTLCWSYRRGSRVHPSQWKGIVNSVVGTALSKNIDEKVRRWVLNALARVGNEETCISTVLYLIKNNPQELQTIASGIAAVYKLCIRSDPEIELAGINFDPQMRTLAALQHVPASQLDLKDLPLNVERANPDLLKLALLLVGLNRSPENLLNPRHSNAQMVKALGKHHDPIVSQYSVWAITENDKLRLLDLGLDLKDIESQPDNVRAWLFQLLGMEATDAEPHLEYVRLGISDPATEARKGLAVGLRNTFFNLLEPLMIDWVTKEDSSDIRQDIMEHIVRQAERSPNYKQYAIEIFEDEPVGSTLRKSMEASAVKTPIYVEFKRIGAGAADFFKGDIVMGSKITKIGNVNAGAVSFDNSTATNHGETKIQVLSHQQVQGIQSELAKLEAALHQDTALPEGEKRKALSHVTKAKNDPSPSKVGEVIEFIGYLGKFAEASSALAPYATTLASAIGLC